MKKRLFSMLLCLLFVIPFAAGCKKNNDSDIDKTYKVVYDFDDEEKVDKELIVPVGKAPSDSSIPEVETKLGYDSKWEEVDFKKIKKGETVTIKPVYTPKTYVVTYDANGGKAIDGSTSVTFDAPYTLKTTTKIGYVFDGYTVGSGETLKEIAVTGDKWQEVSNVILKANWTPAVYTVTYNTNGGSELQPDQVTYDSAYVLKTPTKEGYSFVGWFVGTGAQEVEVMVEGSRWDKISDLTLNAKWREKGPEDYTVTFKQQGQADVVISGDELNESNIPELQERVGYKPGAWQLDGSQVDFNTLVVDRDLIITAVYEAKEYTLKFTYQGGTKISDMVVKYDAPYSLPSYAFESVGLWQAEGWVYDGRVLGENGTWQIDGDAEIEITLKNPKVKVTFIQTGYEEQNTVVFYVDYGTNFLTEYELPDLIPISGATMVWHDKVKLLTVVKKDVTVYGGAWSGDASWTPSV